MLSSARNPDKPVLRNGRRPGISRRTFLSICGLGGVGGTAAVAAYARWVEPFWPRLVRQEMDLPNLPPAFVGYRIVQVSDLHCDREVPYRYLERQLRRCVELKPDLIVVTGDFLTRGKPWLIQVAEWLFEHVSARDGVLAVLGNHDYHDYYHPRPGTERPWGQIAIDLTAALQRSGVRVLRNTRHEIKRGDARLTVVGVEDLRSGYYSPRRAFAGLDPDTPCIALTHNPDAIADLKDRPCDWVLCGHTHGGQVRIPFFGPLYIPNHSMDYDSGLFDVEGTRLYVNHGLGYLKQVRFNCRPEITEFTLTRQTSA